MPDGTASAHLYRPKLLTTLLEGYDWRALRADALAGLTVAIMVLRAWRPAWPAMLIAVGAASLVATLLHLPAETIGSRFGALPSRLPAPQLPRLDMVWAITSNRAPWSPSCWITSSWMAPRATHLT
jgi:MFS superfamily sulfate permease-like transporter